MAKADPRSYLPRIVDRELDELLTALPAIALEGPKGVGKTETALRRARAVYRFDDPAVRAVAAADPSRVLAGEAPILLDEWQRLPGVWDEVRRAVDAGARAGSFLLTGSASPRHLPTHSGAGRVVTVRMRPLSLAERDLCAPSVSLADLLAGTQPALDGACPLILVDYTREIIQSGFPAIRPVTGRAHRALLDGYLRRIVDRDFGDQGVNLRRPASLLAWMRAYAAATATAASYETIRDAATAGDADKPAKSTTIPYRDTLEALWILEPLPAWLPAGNPLSRLTRGPKHHLADPALAARLLGATADSLLGGDEIGPAFLRDGALLGHLFESLATQSVRVYAQQAEARVFHLNTSGAQREVDLIVERADGRVVALEVKLARAIDDADVRHLRWLADKLGDRLLDAAVLSTGPRAYRRADGIGVVPLGLLGA